MEKELKIRTCPSQSESLPLKETLRKQFGSWGEINTAVPLPLMRLSVHLATRFYAHRLYSGGFSVRCPLTDGKRRVRLKVVGADHANSGKVLVYFHGGGGVFARPSSYISVLKNLAYFTRATVVSVDYSRGPRHGFGHSLADCLEALEWCYENTHLLGGEISQLTVSGDSAGGTFAAALCAYCRDNGGPAIHRQVLLNPLTSANAQTTSRNLFAQGYGLTQKRIDFFRLMWYERGPIGTFPYHAPLMLDELGGLPPALVVTSEYDPLRDEGENYALAMHRAGTRTQAVRFLGMGHGMVVFGSDADAARQMYQMVAGFLSC